MLELPTTHRNFVPFGARALKLSGLAFAVFFWLVACAPLADRPMPKAPVAQAPPLPDPLSDPRTLFGWRSAPGGGYRVALPDARGWRAEANTGPWFSLSHSATHSQLWFGSWRASRILTIEECASKVRQALPRVPELESPGATFEKAKVSVPGGFEGELSLAQARRASKTLGRAVLIAARPGACFAAVFLTQSSDSGALLRVLERLTVLADRTLMTARFQRIEQRVSRDKTRE